MYRYWTCPISATRFWLWSPFDRHSHPQSYSPVALVQTLRLAQVSLLSASPAPCPLPSAPRPCAPGSRGAGAPPSAGCGRGTGLPVPGHPAGELLGTGLPAPRCALAGRGKRKFGQTPQRHPVFQLGLLNYVSSHFCYCYEGELSVLCPSALLIDLNPFHCSSSRINDY